MWEPLCSAVAFSKQPQLNHDYANSVSLRRAALLSAQREVQRLLHKHVDGTRHANIQCQSCWLLEVQSTSVQKRKVCLKYWRRCLGGCKNFKRKYRKRKKSWLGLSKLTWWGTNECLHLECWSRTKKKHKA